MKKVLLLGNYQAKYHPVGEFGRRMAELFEDVKVAVTEEAEELRLLKEKAYDLCVIYREFDEEPLSDEQTAVLLAFVAEGGPLLALHNGISIQTRGELAQMLGGRFTEHPPYKELPEVHYLAEDGHPVTEGVGEFWMPDEFYRFETADFAERELLLSYEEEGKRYPAGWVRRFGKGKVLYLCCGHGSYAFDNKAFCRLLENAAGWLMN